MVAELKNRGVADIFIACVDGLKGFPEAIETVFPKTAIQLCIVHMVRHSLNFVGWKQRKEVAADLRLIYTAATEDQAQRQLTEFEAKWDASFDPDCLDAGLHGVPYPEPQLPAVVRLHPGRAQAAGWRHQGMTSGPGRHRTWRTGCGEIAVATEKSIFAPFLQAKQACNPRRYCASS